jgi:undecaprenyl diphosphate synthase
MHVALVMDGNGRWAARRGLPRQAGHRAGAVALRRVVEAAPALGIRVMTAYAFSTDNWKRPAAEVSALMELFGRYLEKETPRCRRNGVRVEVIGRRDRLSADLVGAIEAAREATATGRRMTLRIAVDYSSRDAIHRAALQLAAAEPAERSRERLERLILDPDPSAAPAGLVDLFIRTGGEQRLSDFMLWESAYAELVFRNEMWPDFGPDELADSIADFRRRERRFGGLPHEPARTSRRLRVIS